MKRMINALHKNVRQYEATFGSIQEAEEPKDKIVGFHSQL
jgi:hypothetical protein